MEWLIGLGRYVAALLATVFGWISAAGVIARVGAWLFRVSKKRPAAAWKRLAPWVDRAIAASLVLAAYDVSRDRDRELRASLQTVRDSVVAEKHVTDSLRISHQGEKDRQEAARWRADHPTHVSCAVVSAEGGPDSLVIEVRGTPPRSLEVEPLVFFEAIPQREPTRRADVLYLLDGYFGALLEGGHEGSSRFVYGSRGRTRNQVLHGALTRAVVDTLNARGWRWGGIELLQAVRVSYEDQLGGRFDRCFGAQMFPRDIKPIPHARWRSLRASADSLRRLRRTIDLEAVRDVEPVAARVARDCALAIADSR